MYNESKYGCSKMTSHSVFVFLGELFPNNNLGTVETGGQSEVEDGLFSFPSTMIKFPSKDFGKVVSCLEVFKVHLYLFEVGSNADLSGGNPI